ncbi:hypothetical protein CQ13_29750 [Bradyrhizobium retamae]|uniref:Uncharacterized protein n=1 Tax=Bradyrhizobium retamae TaxID=1300035 RepID=A0A0R3MPZ7_9BRAD|nr:hypothetical protein CQ13_29750 [Bradyrhizobium retamae]
MEFGERSMTTLQAIAFGAMLAWTPSLIILAVSVWMFASLKRWSSRANCPSVRRKAKKVERRLEMLDQPLSDVGPTKSCSRWSAYLDAQLIADGLRDGRSMDRLLAALCGLR